MADEQRTNHLLATLTVAAPCRSVTGANKLGDPSFPLVRRIARTKTCQEQSTVMTKLFIFCQSESHTFDHLRVLDGGSRRV
jgi:hypothetical protein